MIAFLLIVGLLMAMFVGIIAICIAPFMTVGLIMFHYGYDGLAIILFMFGIIHWLRNSGNI